MKERLERWSKHFGLVALFFVSFFFFCYLTFPYGVLKERILSVINNNPSVRIHVGSLGASLPVGVELEKVEISSTEGSNTISFDQVDIGLSLLRLFMAQIYLDIEVENDRGGSLDLGGGVSLFSLLDQNPVPSNIYLSADQFKVDGITGFLVSMLGQGASGSDPMMAMLMPSLKQIDMAGKLNGAVELSLNANQLTESEGKINLTMKQGVLVLGKELGLREQRFEKFLIVGELATGKFNISKKSGIKSQDLQCDMSGEVQLKERFASSLLNLHFYLKLDGGLKQTFGIGLGFIGGSDGEARFALRGPVGQARPVPL